MRRQTEDKCVDSKGREACGGNMDDEAHNGAYGNHIFELSARAAYFYV